MAGLGSGNSIRHLHHTSRLLSTSHSTTLAGITPTPRPLPSLPHHLHQIRRFLPLLLPHFRLRCTEMDEGRRLPPVWDRIARRNATVDPVLAVALEVEFASLTSLGLTSADRTSCHHWTDSS